MTKSKAGLKHLKIYLILKNSLNGIRLKPFSLMLLLKKLISTIKDDSNCIYASARTIIILYMDRLQTLERYKTEQIVEGINGFNGYYAYVFVNICVLESAIYGNATYIIPKDNWEFLSQKTKKELLDNKQVINKIIHNEKWGREIRQVLRKLENQ